MPGSDTTQTARTRLAALTLLVLTALAGCATDDSLRQTPAPRPEEVRALITDLLPAGTPDRQGWAADIYAAFAAMKIAPNPPNICAVLAITAQESSFRADPSVANLAKIAWAEIDRRAERAGVPALAVHLALQLPSPGGKSYSERIDKVRTERDLSLIFEDFIAMAPLGALLFARLNPVRTGGPMQVSIAFAEQHAKDRPYPYPVNGSIRHEVFTRRGGMYFGIAHLLDYPAAYDDPRYRFADFNAGRYASRNAGFQNAVSLASGIPLDLDGDLIRHDADASKPGSTELAVRALRDDLDMGRDAIRSALEQGDGAAFERTTLYKKVFDLADRLARKPVPRAVIPHIALKSPKITRKLTTQWFADRVESRYRPCLARARAASAANSK
ncbi:MAG: DUF1615 domain-containing protein [Burkholderiales bacterium]|nr:DUF1615 domain-containing protein [Burkholderiales bacterium]